MTHSLFDPFSKWLNFEMMASFRSERFSKWPIFDVIDLEVANFYQFTISKMTLFGTYLISKWFFSNWHIFRVTHFLIDPFPKWLILEMVIFPKWTISEVTFFDVINWEEVYFPNEPFSKWIIFEVTHLKWTIF